MNSGHLTIILHLVLDVKITRFIYENQQPFM